MKQIVSSINTIDYNELLKICDNFPYSQLDKNVAQIIEKCDDFDLICHRLFVYGYLSAHNDEFVLFNNVA